MTCKSCGNEIPQGSVFCMFCGERQVKERKKKDEIKVPKPHQLPSGSWRIRLQVEGQSITEATPELCIAKAKAIRAGFMEQKKTTKLSAGKAIEKYIKENSEILSPATLWSYEKIRHNAFPGYMDSGLSSVSWQQAINEEAKRLAPKTVCNEWGLIKTVMKANGIEPPKVNLPKIIKKELPWLSYTQIQTFLEAIHGEDCEMVALLALHSLRRSEILAVTPSKIKPDGIHIEGAVVQVEKGMQAKTTNKTNASRRVVPIMIPRLQELIDSSPAAPDEPISGIYFQTGYKHIQKICRQNGLPEVGYHGLRRSFASLAYHLGWSERQTMAIGGWNNLDVVHRVYIKLGGEDIEEAAQTMREFYENSHENSHEVKKPSE